jgi:hypothetical protein
MSARDQANIDRSNAVMTTGRMDPARLWSRVPLARVLLLAFLMAVGAAGSARADFGFIPGSVSADAFDEAGAPETQAGAHPYAAVADFKLQTTTALDGREVPDEQVRDVEVDLPQGFAGNPQNMPKCSWEYLNTGIWCPSDTAVGYVLLDWFAVSPPRVTGRLPLYNMEPSEGHVAEFGFKTSLGTNQLVASVRPGDAGIRIRAVRTPQGGPVFGVKVVIWGVPGDASHNGDRMRFCQAGVEDPNRFDDYCRGFGYTPFNSEVKPFLTNPTACGSATTRFKARSWLHPDRWDSVVFSPEHDVDGCERLSFDPTMSVQPDTRQADAPSGLLVDIGVPQDETPYGLATSALKDAKVTFPEGMTVNPSSADGLGACSDAQIALQSEDDPTCPESSKIGTLSLETPVLTKPLEGDVYLGRQTENQLIRMFLVLKGQGVLLKIPGKVDADPVTGRLVTTFKNNPQLPFSSLKLRLKSGPRAPLAMPASCGPKTTEAELTPWSGGPVKTVTDTFVVDCPGMSGFSPALTAGTLSSAGGTFSPFTVGIPRPDRQEFLDGLTLSMPTGLTARLRGVPVCAEAQAAAGTCGAESRVGSATVGSGPGTNPFYLRDQPVYLAGPYKGAPYSLSVVNRVVAGPLDLGTVLVRQALYVDPIDAHITAVSDPLPTIIKGIPLRLRSIDVKVDRPGFMINPTDCAAKQIAATLHSQQGSTVQQTVRFQASSCRNLAFKPALSMSLSGKGQTTDGKHPTLKAVVTAPNGGANIKKVKVRLPLSLALDTDNAQALCEFKDGNKAEPTCPKGSIVGSAVAQTPILDEPLRGPVYFVKNVRTDRKSGRAIRTLPMIVIPLVGQNGIKLTLKGESSTERNKYLVNTFNAVPDQPVSRFELTINGGKHGILAVSGTNICTSKQKAYRYIDGQNGKQSDGVTTISTPACKAKKTAKKAHKTK